MTTARAAQAARHGLTGQGLTGQGLTGQGLTPHRRTAARHRRPPERRPIVRSAGIALVVSGLVAAALGLRGWVLHDGARARFPSHGASGASRGHGASRGSGTSHASHGASGKGFAAGAPGPAGRISGPSRRSKHTSVARPYWLLIPAIGVSSNLIRLGLTAQDTLRVPPSAAVAGWYTGSPRPGQVGSSIIAGHIDSRSGPGVFYHLSRLRRGDYVYIIRADHTVAVFEVTSLRTYVKSSFPANAVYGPVPDAELRLITCGGTFDYATGSYLANIVVYATLIS